MITPKVHCISTLRSAHEPPSAQAGRDAKRDSAPRELSGEHRKLIDLAAFRHHPRSDPNDRIVA